ncbi:hypothetical protein HN51_019427 [Arachis hypogaea]|uniref:Uncharacterized protein n=1 Tax=Arachis hypogaea TaxID=3818 RepID=A0A445BXC8_ARAHY|nr:uncharacterized protein LOC112707004 [Arachis hypogaea]QHO31184.1 uncharacterized protein DS421_8g239430 [Arachis hypogaea]RYR43196.1 hypothetical protein Ahy_A08g039625 [Arachis hypogaea]
MWNCMRNSKVSAEDTDENEPVKRRSASDGDRTSGTRRIRLVVNKEELRRMARENDAQQYASLAQLLKDMKMREKRMSEVEEEHDGSMNSWRPALESIPEV